MMELTKDIVESVVADKSHKFSSWNRKSIGDFISIWETRHSMAIDFHHDSRLEVLAKSILDFVAERPPENLRMYAGPYDEGNFGFLYDTETHEFVQMIGTE